MRCPAGGKFGVDIDELENFDGQTGDVTIACNRCKVYQVCQNEFSKSLLKKKRKKLSSPEMTAKRKTQLAAAQARLADNPSYIEDEHQPVNVKLDNLIHDVLLDWLNGETDEDLIFKTRAKVVKRFARHLKLNYASELANRRPYDFPLDWMKDATRSSRTFDRWPIIAWVMQYLYLRKRNLDAALMKAHLEQDKLWIGDKGYVSESGNWYPYATFKTDVDFYADLGRFLSNLRGEQPSQNYMWQIITAFKNAKIIIQLAGSKRNGFIVADGYYKEYSGRWTKQLFLKNTPEYREALQSMTI